MTRTRMIRQLSELADLEIEVGRHLRRMALTAETPRAKAELATAFLAVAYEVRRTVDLELRLTREDGRLYRASRPHSDRRLETDLPPDSAKH